MRSVADQTSFGTYYQTIRKIVIPLNGTIPDITKACVLLPNPARGLCLGANQLGVGVYNTRPLKRFSFD